MVVYLETHPPARRQFYTSRRQPVTVIGLHTAENTTDLVLPDDGAEAVARFIATRSTPGSYASVVDSDSTVRVGEYGWTMFHIAGFNSLSLGLSFATLASQWDVLPGSWVDGALTQGAVEAARMCQWVARTHGWVIPPRLLSAHQARTGGTGFVTHATMDPDRRTDPGTEFPWPEFARRYRAQCLELGIEPGPVQKSNPSHTTGRTHMTTYDKEVAAAAERLQRVVSAHGADLGTTGPNSDGIDKVAGPATLNAASVIIDDLSQRLSTADAQVDTALAQIVELEIERDKLAARLAGPPADTPSISHAIMDKAALADQIIAAEAAKARAVKAALEQLS